MKINAIFRTRQQHLLSTLNTTDIAIVFATKKHHSDFYYLTGFEEHDAIAVFAPSNPEGEYILFSKSKNPKQEQWTGNIIGQKTALAGYGADKAFPLEDITRILPQLIQSRQQVYTNLDYNNLIANIGITAPSIIIDIGTITYEMRLFKDQSEIDLMRQAVQITTHAIQKIMQNCLPEMKEYELTAIVAYEFLHNDAQNAFEPVVASGKNTCTLHYEHGRDAIKSGDLVLIDIGAEYAHYASDVSRTFPANGKFTPEQKAIYQIVLDTQLAVIKLIKPGVTWNDLQTTATKLITTNLIKLGILQGDLEQLITDQAYKQFYPHNIGHWLGLDAHDTGDCKRLLAPNMVLTIEPGIYISENIPDIDQKWANIGVRIEDVILVTDDGCEVLSADAPKTIDAIETIMTIDGITPASPLSHLLSFSA